jgi:transposase
MKTTYILGIDAAKHKVRAALRGAQEEPFLFEKDLPVSAAGLRELLAKLKERVPKSEQLLVLIEATGILHLNWAAGLVRAGYAVMVINPLMARRLYSVENSIRDNKSDPIDARALCRIPNSFGAGQLHQRCAQARIAVFGFLFQMIGLIILLPHLREG